MKRLNKKGFTMAELLIVVAIIAVLVAIAIPVFTSQLEKSRDAVSVSNMRAAYAEASTAKLAGSTDSRITVNDDGTVTVTGVTFKGTNSSDNFSGLAGELPFTGVQSSEPTKGDHKMTFTFGDTGVTATIGD